MGNALVPEFAVTNCAASKAFYCDVLGFTCAFERPEEGFAYLKLGDAEVMIDEIGQGRTFENGHLPTQRPFGRGLNVQIKVPDITPLLSALAAADHQLYMQPEDKWYRNKNIEAGNRQFVCC
ncbi:VOC family protein [Shimia sp. NS0008-38b]|uniref:bleomycin resistance protein n=1 Tax=Shimia sp. NS0008-38b TaxID=3127653 RepID=UPI00310AD32B